jgi:hypothetical protein
MHEQIPSACRCKSERLLAASECNPDSVGDADRQIASAPTAACSKMPKVFHASQTGIGITRCHLLEMQFSNIYNDPMKGTLCFARCRGSLFSLNRSGDFFDAKISQSEKPRLTSLREREREREREQDSCLTRGKLRSPFLSTTEPSGTRGPRKRACILFRAVSVPCGQQGSRQYLCRRNCPPTSKGVSKRINFTRRREKGVNI